ncbi:hypothetical protein Aph01nite_34580 [Acrocarpospora phusangensis]|uniref:Helix-turn-helix domain-containing protein n=1 Tax=Acrocarpospora phusangensis TaxID=1070424 RepID=A0A919QAN0_9ACTN|nr:hypothetical protein [Acrocarpospora phusangensis]GIH25148.1 hypothetical protein Aph01nite_34580 [Acrocarpospora phusangensis]
MKTTQAQAAIQPPADRRATRVARPADDRLLLLPEIAKYIRREEETIRWWRKTRYKDAPPVWKQAGRIVAWKSEIDAWLDAQRDADLENANAE